MIYPISMLLTVFTHTMKFPNKSLKQLLSTVNSLENAEQFFEFSTNLLNLEFYDSVLWWPLLNSKQIFTENSDFKIKKRQMAFAMNLPASIFPRSILLDADHSKLLEELTSSPLDLLAFSFVF